MARTRDELLHFSSGPHLASVSLGGLGRVEDDDESLDYSVVGVLEDAPGELKPWLDEPV